MKQGGKLLVNRFMGEVKKGDLVGGGSRVKYKAHTLCKILSNIKLTTQTHFYSSSKSYSITPYRLRLFQLLNTDWTKLTMHGLLLCIHASAGRHVHYCT